MDKWVQERRNCRSRAHITILKLRNRANHPFKNCSSSFVTRWSSPSPGLIRIMRNIQPPTGSGARMYQRLHHTVADPATAKTVRSFPPDTRVYQGLHFHFSTFQRASQPEVCGVALRLASNDTRAMKLIVECQFPWCKPTNTRRPPCAA